MDRAYLDNNATTPLAPEVADFLDRHQRGTFGNASSIHAAGREARRVLDEARERLAAALAASPREVVFTGSGSEADSLAIIGSFLQLRTTRPHLVTTAVEHPAVLNAVRFCERELGAQATIVPAQPDGTVGADAVLAALRPQTGLVSMMAANNETGARLPVAEVGDACRERGVRFHCDAVQTVGRVPVRFEDLPVDLLALSAHKFHGPKGVGALLVRRGTRLSPLVQGGGQERGLRPGTESAALAGALALAAEIATESLASGADTRMAALRDRLEAALTERIPETVVNGPTARDLRVPNTSSLSFPGAEAEGMLIGLDRAGICVSTGSACASGSVEPSHVLTAMGLDRERLSSSLRFSVSRYTTDAEVDRVVETLPPIVERLRAAG